MRRQAPPLPGTQGGVLPLRPRARPGRARRARRRRLAARRGDPDAARARALPPRAATTCSPRSSIGSATIPACTRSRSRARASRAARLRSARAAVADRARRRWSTARASSPEPIVVVSAGGTMNREAVALGVPVYTTFAGRLGAVDERLLADGRLRRLERVGDLVLERRTSTAPRVRRDPDWFVQQILEVAGDLAERIEQLGPVVARRVDEHRRLGGVHRGPPGTARASRRPPRAPARDRARRTRARAGRSPACGRARAPTSVVGGRRDDRARVEPLARLGVAPGRPQPGERERLAIRRACSAPVASGRRDPCATRRSRRPRSARGDARAARGRRSATAPSRRAR